MCVFAKIYFFNLEITLQGSDKSMACIHMRTTSCIKKFCIILNLALKKCDNIKYTQINKLKNYVAKIFWTIYLFYMLIYLHNISLTYICLLILSIYNITVICSVLKTNATMPRSEEETGQTVRRMSHFLPCNSRKITKYQLFLHNLMSLVSNVSTQITFPVFRAWPDFFLMPDNQDRCIGVRSESR